MTPTITTQTAVRAAFWDAHHDQPWAKLYRASKRQNDYPTDVRVSFVDYVDSLCKNGQISEALASRVTL